MKLTGHKTNAMFLRYSHIDQEQSESAMKKLNGFLSEKNSVFIGDPSGIRTRVTGVRGRRPNH